MVKKKGDALHITCRIMEASYLCLFYNVIGGVVLIFFFLLNGFGMA